LLIVAYCCLLVCRRLHETESIFDGKRDLNLYRRGVGGYSGRLRLHVLVSAHFCWASSNRKATASTATHFCHSFRENRNGPIWASVLPSGNVALLTRSKWFRKSPLRQPNINRTPSGVHLVRSLSRLSGRISCLVVVNSRLSTRTDLTC